MENITYINAYTTIRSSWWWI